MAIKAYAIGALLIGGALLLAGSAQAVKQTKEQQKCITKINKDANKVQETQGKEVYRCAGQDRLDDTTNMDECIVKDDLSKVSKKTSKTTKDESKFCTVANVPDFAYTSAANANAQALKADSDLVHDLWGDPNNVDPNFWPCNPYEDECVCQRTSLFRIEKLFKQLGQQFYMCKKNALKENKEPFNNGAEDPNDLARCVWDGATATSVAADELGKIAARVKDIADGITDETCNDSGDQDSFAGPECNRTALAPIDDAKLKNCIVSRVYCRFCLMIEAMDNLSIDCNAFIAGEVSPDYATCP